MFETMTSRLRSLVLGGVLVTGCVHAPPAPPAPLVEQLSSLAARHPGWELPDTAGDTAIRHFVTGDVTGDSIPDRGLLITRGERAVIYFLRGTGEGKYAEPIEVGHSRQLGRDVLFIQEGELRYGKRSSDDFIAWTWDRRRERLTLVRED